MPRHARRSSTGPVGLLIVALFTSSTWADEGTPPVDFNRDVRPILSGKCFACHGPDDGKRKAGLRLDQREAAIREADSGETAIMPGKPDESELIARVLSVDDSTVMPPPATHKSLSDREKEILRRWIAEGAEYKVHWAFQKPVRSTLPKLNDTRGIRNEIDAFVMARLESRGMNLSPEADRTALIRRLSLDLIGLPPTIAEIDAFVADPSPDAYEKVVDRLLKSPHYGERWARRWLDRARYADTNGYEKDRERSIWPYRDWVIRVLNDDLPFDQFTIEQIAGDLLPDATTPRKVASGFHRNTMINEEGGIDVEEFRFASVVDRVATTGSVWLGLTIQCAQCHTHKFDPITQREYYRFLSFLDNADEPDLELPTPEIEKTRLEIASKIAAIEADLPNRFPARDESAAWQTLKPIRLESASGTTLTARADGSILASGAIPEKDAYTIAFESPPIEIAALRLETLTDPTLPRSGPGRALNGNFVISELRVAIVGETSRAIVLDRAEAEVSQSGFDAHGLIDGDLASGWAIDDGSGQMNRPRSATITFKEPVRLPSGSQLTVFLDQGYGGKHTLGSFRISARSPVPDPTPEARRRNLEVKRAEWESRIAAIPWKILTPSRVVSRKNATMTVLDDGSVLASGDKPNNDTYDVEIASDLEKITALRLEVLPDPSLPENGPGRAPLFSVGDFLLTEFEVFDAAMAGRKIAIREASQDFAAPGKGANLAIDGKPDTGWSIAGGVGREHQAVFVLGEEIVTGKGTKLRLVLHQDFIHQTTIGRFRISVTGTPGAIRASGLPDEVESSLTIPPSGRSKAQLARIERYFLSIAPEMARENQELASLRKSIPRASTTMVMRERSSDQARTTRIRNRGEFLQPTEAVTPGVPAFLPGLPTGAKPDRLALARWLVSADNPLTSRVAVNQAWQAFFGRGLVATVEDFGTRGDEPSNPELLDWLATEFVRLGWSQKAIHRLIVTSATYRQSSKSTPEAMAIDPANIFLGRGPRFRVDAEVVRDLALSVSGLLDTSIGGPSVYPPQPDGVTSLAYGMAAWPASVGPSRYRRGLYTFTKRTAPYASFATFDAPSPEIACVRRERSNTPLQALTLLNDVVFVEASRELARRILSEPSLSFDGRIRFAFRLCLGRRPSDREIETLGDFFEKQAERFRTGGSDADAVAGNAPKTPRRFDPVELAAWTVLARVLLNLDETITKE